MELVGMFFILAALTMLFEVTCKGYMRKSQQVNRNRSGLNSRR